MISWCHDVYMIFTYKNQAKIVFISIWRETKFRVKDSNLLGYDTTSLGNGIPMF